MRNVLILYREDLREEHVLNAVKDIYLSQFKTYISHSLENADMVVFYCILTDEDKILKNRHGAGTKCINTTYPEGDTMLLSFILGMKQ